jgi:hypothetical protein
MVHEPAFLSFLSIGASFAVTSPDVAVAGRKCHFRTKLRHRPDNQGASRRRYSEEKRSENDRKRACGDEKVLQRDTAAEGMLSAEKSLKIKMGEGMFRSCGVVSSAYSKREIPVAAKSRSAEAMHEIQVMIRIAPRRAIATVIGLVQALLFQIQ